MEDFLGREVRAGDWFAYRRIKYGSPVTGLYYIMEVRDGVKALRFGRGWKTEGKLAYEGISNIKSVDGIVVIPEDYVPEEILTFIKENK